MGIFWSVNDQPKYWDYSLYILSLLSSVRKLENSLIIQTRVYVWMSQFLFISEYVFQAMSFYWAFTNIFSICQAKALRVEGIRQKFGIPKIKKQKLQKIPRKDKGIIEQFRESKKSGIIEGKYRRLILFILQLWTTLKFRLIFVTGLGLMKGHAGVRQSKPINLIQWKLKTI